MFHKILTHPRLEMKIQHFIPSALSISCVCEYNSNILMECKLCVFALNIIETKLSFAIISFLKWFLFLPWSKISVFVQFFKSPRNTIKINSLIININLYSFTQMSSWFSHGQKYHCKVIKTHSIGRPDQNGGN